MFSVHITPEELKKRNNHRSFWILFEKKKKKKKTRAAKSHEYREVIVSNKLGFQNVFCPHENEKPAFSNSSDFKSVFEKFRFLDGLEWTVGLTVEIKLLFQITPA